VISTKDVVTTVNAGTTTVVTTVVTERKSVITAKQTDLFFAAGTLSIYPAKDIPEAEVV
jgi:hypothetical protein